MATSVLLCDSSEGLALLQYALIKSGAQLEIEVVLDGYHAVDVASRIKPDLVVTEVDVEGLSGPELVRRLLAAAPETRVLCWTAATSPDLVAAVFAAGATGYLLKETGPEEVASALDPILKNQVVLSPSVAAALGERLSSWILREPELEAALSEAKDKLALVTQAKAEFLANVSHEFRTPVTIAKGIAYVLKNRGIPEEEQQEFLDKLETSLDKLMTLVDEILTIADLDRGALALNLTEVDLTPVIGHLCDEAQTQYPEASLELLLPERLFANVDSVRVSEVVRQLLDNACRYSPPDERVTIKARSADEGLTVTVIDRGQGVRRDVVTQAFNEPFTAGEEILRKERSGIGVGLHMARQLILQHGGIMWADPLPGGGTRVSFCIPNDRDRPVTHPPRDSVDRLSVAREPGAAHGKPDHPTATSASS
ncbi:MAG: ATP-binding protein [Actinomycetota bacterium]|nr:ATP-binding protein [Actinomycetota bacterium]